MNTEYPKMIEVKIINDGTCLRRSPALLPITSDRTFCATGAKDEGPCQGDSGGGLILHKENKWFLRGLVSASERSKKGSVCDPGIHVVFTDTAKFVSWTQSIKFFAEVSKVCVLKNYTETTSELTDTGLIYMNEYVLSCSVDDDN